MSQEGYRGYLIAEIVRNLAAGLPRFWQEIKPYIRVGEPKAQLCPVCGGSGTYRGRTPNDPALAHVIEITCHGCKGTGWVVVWLRPKES